MVISRFNCTDNVHFCLIIRTVKFTLKNRHMYCHCGRADLATKCPGVQQTFHATERPIHHCPFQNSFHQFLVCSMCRWTCHTCSSWLPCRDKVTLAILRGHWDVHYLLSQFGRTKFLCLDHLFIDGTMGTQCFFFFQQVTSGKAGWIHKTRLPSTRYLGSGSVTVQWNVSNKFVHN